MLPRRSRASPPAASAPQASRSFLTPCHLPRSTPPSGPALVPASCLSPAHRFKPPSIDEAGERIGILLWRVRKSSARFAAGRSRPQVEPFRRPTAIPLDPAPTSAASVFADFVPKSFAKGKGPQALQRWRGGRAIFKVSAGRRA